MLRQFLMISPKLAAEAAALGILSAHKGYGFCVFAHEQQIRAVVGFGALLGKI